MHRVLVLGAYGFFGSRISAALAQNPHLQLILAGRDGNKATALAYQVGLTANHARVVDATDPRLGPLMKKLGVQTVIHTVGPFQQQNYAVATAAIQAGSHYIDLADGRAFVTGITALDAAARAAGVSVVSGASTVPALSSAVVDKYLPYFARLEKIAIGISSGGRMPGLATVRSVFAYCGKPVRTWEGGRPAQSLGWLDTQVHEFPKPVGPRRLGRCDVPDTDLFPTRYPNVQTVGFHGGFGSDAGHKLVEQLARMVRDGRLASALPFARALFRVGRLLEPLLSDSGGMFVRLSGTDEDQRPRTLLWQLVASENHGPHIPCGAAIALLGKIAAAAPPPAGAMPCMGLLTIKEYLQPFKGLRIREIAPPVPTLSWNT